MPVDAVGRVHRPQSAPYPLCELLVGRAKLAPQLVPLVSWGTLVAVHRRALHALAFKVRGNYVVVSGAAEGDKPKWLFVPVDAVKRLGIAQAAGTFLWQSTDDECIIPEAEAAVGLTECGVVSTYASLLPGLVCYEDRFWLLLDSLSMKNIFYQLEIHSPRRGMGGETVTPPRRWDS